MVKDGEANASDCLVKLGMAPYGQSCPRVEATKSSCQPQMCVGVAKTNFVYELSQGDLSLLSFNNKLYLYWMHFLSGLDIFEVGS